MIQYLPRTTPLRSAIYPLSYVRFGSPRCDVAFSAGVALHTLCVVVSMGLTCGRWLEFWRSLPGNHLETNHSTFHARQSWICERRLDKGWAVTEMGVCTCWIMGHVVEIRHRTFAVKNVKATGFTDCFAPQNSFVLFCWRRLVNSIRSMSCVVLATFKT